MCGIVAGIGRVAVEAGLKAIAHRGPDGEGIKVVGDVTLGHVRLAIQDLSSMAAQPMTRGEITVSYNGELWNAPGLRTELEALGHRFTTRSDTEVVAAAIDEWDTLALEKFDGQFAIAWARSGRTLYVARDRFGEVPLHVAVGSGLYGSVLVASEMAALLEMGADHSSVSDVEPGTWAAFSWAEKVHDQRYYDAPTSAITIEKRKASDALRTLLEAATKKRLVGDVPVCVLLSGGIDSASIAACVVACGVKPTAYTAVFDDHSADLKRARMTAAHLGLRLIEVACPSPCERDLEDTVIIIEQPSQAQVEIAWPCRKLAEVIRADGFKVVLSGEGSDELWASYGFSYHGVKKDGWHAYRKKAILAQARKNFARCNKVFMRSGVECRLPFVDRNVVEFGLSLPEAVVNDGSRKKAVLRDAFAGILPEEVVCAPKVAFQDGMGLKQAIGLTIPNRRGFYGRSYARIFG